MKNTYNELLKNPKWAKIRKEVLKRDLLECQVCQNKKIKEKSVLGKIVSIKRVLTALELLNKSDPRFNKLYKVNYLDSFGSEHSEEIKAIYEFNEHELKKFQGEILYFNKAKNLSFLNTQSTYTMITCIPDQTEKIKWFYANQLHIHHAYYKSDKQPWDYPIESLKTLCWVCHAKEHEN